MNDYEFWNELGKIFNAVVAYQEKAVEFNNRFINPWIRLGNVFDKEDRNQESIRAYEKALELDPANAQNWYELGNLYFREKGYEKAIEAYNKAIEFAPQSGWAYNNLALTLVSQGKYAEALPLYQKGVDLIDDDKDKAMVWNRIGNVYRKLNEYDLAVQSFHRADELDAENAGFRDELDDVPESTVQAQSNADQDLEQKSKENLNPIQLILSESQAEDKALAEDETLSETIALSDTNAIEPSSVEPSSEEVTQVAHQGEEDRQSRQPPARLLQQQYRQRKNRFFQQRTYVRATVIASAEVNNPPDTVTLSDANATELSSSEDIAQNVEKAEDTTLAETNNLSDTVTLSDVNAAELSSSEEIAQNVEKAEDITLAKADNLPNIVALSDTPATELSSSEGITQQGIGQVISEPVIVQNENTEDKNALEIAGQPNNGETTENSISANQPDQELIGDQQTTTMVIQDSSETYTEIPEIVTVTTTDTTKVVITTEEGGDSVVAEPEANQNVSDESSVIRVELDIEDETESIDSNAAEQSAYEAFLKENQDLVVKSEEESDDPMPDALQEPAAFVDSSGDLQIEMDTKNAHVWNELGNIYFNTGTYDDAIVAYSKAIQLDRCFAWPYSNLALTYVQKGRFTEAILLYQRSIELFTSEKDKAISWNRLGNVYRRLNNYDSAIAAYQRADELDPENTTLSLQSRFSLLGNYPVEQQSSYVSG